MSSKEPLTTDEIAARVAADIEAGSVVNLGIGRPTAVADHLRPGSGVVLHTENGMLNMGPRATGDDVDPDLTNAGKQPVTELPGASYFHHADSFAMMRGGHLDVCVLGAYQVSRDGDLANWSTGKGAIPAVGGAMDLVQSAKRVAVVTDHVTKTGEPKLVDTCTMPLTGVQCVTRVYTSLAVVDIAEGHFVLREKLPAISFDALQDLTGAELKTEGPVADLTVPETCPPAFLWSMYPGGVGPKARRGQSPLPAKTDRVRRAFRAALRWIRPRRPSAGSAHRAPPPPPPAPAAG